MSFSKGLNAIDYNRKASNCSFKTDSSGNIMITAKLQFENLSNSEVKFYIKFIPNTPLPDDIITKDPVTAEDIETNNPKEFAMEPNTRQNLQAYFMIHTNKVNSFQGSAENLNIIIYTADEEKQFIKN